VGGWRLRVPACLPAGPACRQAWQAGRQTGGDYDVLREWLEAHDKNYVLCVPMKEYIKYNDLSADRQVSGYVLAV
jgi:hypothetical protein